MSVSQLYFAYGSNMCPEQMRLRCPASEAVGAGVLAGFSFLINERGVATIQEHEQGEVHGVIWRLTAECESSLDVHEGLKHGNYRKQQVAVAAEDGSLRALTYIDHRTRFGRPRPGYLDRVLNGAAAFGLPQEYRKQLERWAWVEVK